MGSIDLAVWDQAFRKSPPFPIITMPKDRHVVVQEMLAAARGPAAPAKAMKAMKAMKSVKAAEPAPPLKAMKKTKKAASPARAILKAMKAMKKGKKASCLFFLYLFRKHSRVLKELGMFSKQITICVSETNIHTNTRGGDWISIPSRRRDAVHITVCMASRRRDAGGY